MDNKNVFDCSVLRSKDWKVYETITYGSILSGCRCHGQNGSQWHHRASSSGCLKGLSKLQIFPVFPKHGRHADVKTELLSSFRAMHLRQMSDKSSAARLIGALDLASGWAFGVQTASRHFDNSLPVFDPVTCTKRTADKWSLIDYVEPSGTIFAPGSFEPSVSFLSFFFLSIFCVCALSKRRWLACRVAPFPFFLSNIKAGLG